MLISLSVKNFLIIDSIYIDFFSGLSVITGETGSGKSMIIDALLFCFGTKIESPVRKNCEQCSVVVEFDIRLNSQVQKFLSDNSLDFENTLIIKRQDHISQRKKFFVNDQQVTQKLVTQLASYLLEIHGQHSTTILLDSKSHLDILDAYANLASSRKLVEESYQRWQENGRKISDVSSKKGQNLHEISYLEFATKELEQAEVKPDEEGQLLEARNALQQVFQRQKTFYQASALLEETNIVKSIAQLLKILGKDQSMVNCLELLDQAIFSILEVQDILNTNLLEENVEQQIVAIEDRLFEIRALAKKHNVSVADLALFLREGLEKLDLLRQDIFDAQSLVQQQEKLFDDYKEACAFLSNARQDFARQLEQKINAELAELISASSSFRVFIEHSDFENGSSRGIDQVRFTVSTNVGMDHMPIDQVASGGELSRIMLAIKSVMLASSTKPVIIFDEIDTGVGGSVAETIGEKLKTLSKISQIISITHQAQIASKADAHIFVSKTQDNAQTFCRVKILDIEEKIQELARMISGKHITAKTREVAREMLS